MYMLAVRMVVNPINEYDKEFKFCLTLAQDKAAALAGHNREATEMQVHRNPPSRHGGTIKFSVTAHNSRHRGALCRPALRNA
jgi:hypothetical protein